MLLPVNWLKEYVDLNVETKELADKLTLSGSNIESINRLDSEVKNVVVGKILSIVPHENADKLVVCKIDVGQEVLQIVTGAKNMKEEDYVAVAKVGALLPGDFKIKKSKLRGVESFGMLCSFEELGYSDNVISKHMKEGILILDKEYPLGTDIVDVLGMDTEVFEIEITPNRPDCLSIIGMGREAAAALKTEIKMPEIKIKEEVEDINNYLTDVSIESENCDRYFVKVLKDVKITDSPLWLQTSLMNAGIRPVNNIVDITNYVMLEYGEPLHAFDLDKINGKEIIVRQAEKDEIIKTLDGEDRKLDENDLVIADSKEPIAIAGVMGGFDSEITDKTTTVLLEGACFNPRNVRLTSKKLNLRSEASSRFEKGVDPKLSQIAVERVCQLAEELEVGKVVDSNIDKFIKDREEIEVTLRPERVNKVLGIKIGAAEILDYLNSLGLKSELINGKIVSTIPTHRTDIKIEADLIEEVGRLYGFHNIKPEPLKGALTQGEKPYSRKVGDLAKFCLQGFGFNEVMTYSFISPKSYDKILIPENDPLREYIELINPLGLDYSVMRTTLIPTMMELLARNNSRGVESVFAFEIGNSFIPTSIPVVDLPEEKKVLSLGFYGEKDFYFLKESVDKTLARLGIEDLDYIRESDNPTFHPGRTAKIMKDGEYIGIIGEAHPDVRSNYEIKSRVYLGQIDFDKVIELTNFNKEFKHLPKYPSVSRDIAVVLDKDILVGEIEKIIKKHGKDLVEDIKLFDIYTGDQIADDKKSVAYSIVYRSHEGTLKDDDVNRIQNKIIKDLEEKLDGKLRS